ncbi:hypothetical protein GCM10010273_57160 [Streptomyces lavendulocolor]
MTRGKAVAPLSTRQTMKNTNHTRMRRSRAPVSLMSAAYAGVYTVFTGGPGTVRPPSAPGLPADCAKIRTCNRSAWKTLPG